MTNIKSRLAKMEALAAILEDRPILIIRHSDGTYHPGGGVYDRLEAIPNRKKGPAPDLIINLYQGDR